MNYYISDTHFGHVNIVRYDHANGGRNFDSILTHDSTIFKNWNETVNPDDTVYILGDFSWLPKYPTEKILSELNGHKILIRGNHDKVMNKMKEKGLVDDILDYAEVIDSGYKIVLSHYPILMWNGQHNNAIHFYGHVHNTIEHDMYKNSLQNTSFNMEKMGSINSPLKAFNVGCMINYMDYTPRTAEYIINNGDK